MMKSSKEITTNNNHLRSQLRCLKGGKKTNALWLAGVEEDPFLQQHYLERPTPKTQISLENAHLKSEENSEGEYP